MAKLLGFGYPGGPVIDQSMAPYGNPRAIRSFPLARMKGNEMDFGFSGLKTAVLRWTQAQDLTSELSGRRRLVTESPWPTPEQWLTVTPQRTLDLLASFQYTVIQELLRHAASAEEQIGAESVVIVQEALRAIAGLPEHRSACIPRYASISPPLVLRPTTPL